MKVKVVLIGIASALLLSFCALNVSASPTNNYWLAASDGGVFAFGDAGYYGSTGNTTLNKPIVGMTSSYGGEGYYLVAGDGGVFTFGDAVYFGSIQSDPNLASMYNSPYAYGKVVGIVRNDEGYWIYDNRGSIRNFGGAYFLTIGSASNRLNKPIVGMAAKPYYSSEWNPYGAWLVASDGGVFTAGALDILAQLEE